MRRVAVGAAALAVMLASAPTQAYDGLKADYATCTTGAGKVSKELIVGACTRLIDNSAKKNELVGFFHALRASSNTNKKLNCQDAHAAFKLLNSNKLKKLARQLADANC